MFWFLLVGPLAADASDAVVVIHSAHSGVQWKSTRARVSWQMLWTGKDQQIYSTDVLVYECERYQNVNNEKKVSKNDDRGKKPKINWRDFVYGQFEMWANI